MKRAAGSYNHQADQNVAQAVPGAKVVRVKQRYGKRVAPVCVQAGDIQVQGGVGAAVHIVGPQLFPGVAVQPGHPEGEEILPGLPAGVDVNVQRHRISLVDALADGVVAADGERDRDHDILRLPGRDGDGTLIAEGLPAGGHRGGAPAAEAAFRNSASRQAEF